LTVGSQHVLIVGGGLAGCTAAIAAAREGVRTLLVEQHGYLGGNATRAMVAPWQSFHAAKQQSNGELPQQVIGGIAQEFVDDLVARGASPGHIVDPIGFAGSITPVDSEELKLYLPWKLEREGVEIQLNTVLTASLLAEATQVVDASGWAAAVRMIGADYIEPRQPQPMTWMFTVGPVDTAAVRDYQLAHPEEFVLHAGFTGLRSDYIAVSGFFSLVRQAKASGDLTIPRDRLLFFSTPRHAEVLINTTRITADHHQPRLEGLRQVRELLHWLPRNVPGFERARITRLADDIGQRESYRLNGLQTLNVNDILEGRRYPDAIARGCYPVDIHSSTSEELATREVGGSGWYDIPLGCLQSAAHPNLLVAGRCISADRQGFASARVLPTAMATGQAAGYLAACKAQKKFPDLISCVSRISLV
jgi:glycine/D-amino acid oxidase-like deaminating enzyme